MMIMRWCSLQTNEHDLQAIMYPTVCKYHRLNIKNGNKIPVFPGYICNRWQNMIVQPSQTHNHGKIWQQWERWIQLQLKAWHFSGMWMNWTHWGLLLHICVGEKDTISSGDSLPPVGCHAITCIKDHLLPIQDVKLDFQGNAFRTIALTLI